MSRLSQRQRELVRHLIAGLALKEAADKMNVGHAAAKSYLCRARIKLGYRTNWQLLYEIGREEHKNASS